jgi:ABC-2 type transport system permease protein
MFRLVLRMQVTRGRAAALGGLGLLVIILAVAVRNGADSDPATGMFDVIDHLGLAVLAPISALVLASAALGDLAEDRTLVYVWLRPVDRWRMTLGAFGATLCAALPFVLVPLAVAVAISGVGNGLLLASLASAAIAVAGYAALFLGLGLRVKRALVWGLAYVVIWEGAVARAARGAARLSVQVYARSLLAAMADHTPPRQAAGTATAVIVPLVIVVLGYLVTVRWLQRADVA